MPTNLTKAKIPTVELQELRVLTRNMFPFWQIPHSFFIIQNTSSFMTRIEENTLTRPIILIYGPVTNQGLLLIKTKPKQNKI